MSNYPYAPRAGWEQRKNAIFKDLSTTMNLPLRMGQSSGSIQRMQKALNILMPAMGFRPLPETGTFDGRMCNYLTKVFGSRAKVFGCPSIPQAAVTNNMDHFRLSAQEQQHYEKFSQQPVQQPRPLFNRQEMQRPRMLMPTRQTAPPPIPTTNPDFESLPEDPSEMSPDTPTSFLDAPSGNIEDFADLNFG